MPLSHADGVHDMLDWIGPKISHNGPQSERDANNRALANECIERMDMHHFTDAMKRELVFHLEEFSHVIVTRIRAACPAVFSSGDDVDFYLGHPASVTE